MQLVNKLRNQTVYWSELMRPRVGVQCLHSAAIWVNTTGMNSEPAIGADWQFLEYLEQKLKIATKGTGNTSKLPEANDIMFGSLDDGTYIPFGKYLGGDLQVIENYVTNPISF